LAWKKNFYYKDRYETLNLLKRSFFDSNYEDKVILEGVLKGFKDDNEEYDRIVKGLDGVLERDLWGLR
jgi:hypothetical protein